MFKTSCIEVVGEFWKNNTFAETGAWCTRRSELLHATASVNVLYNSPGESLARQGECYRSVDLKARRSEWEFAVASASRIEPAYLWNLLHHSFYTRMQLGFLNLFNSV